VIKLQSFRAFSLLVTLLSCTYGAQGMEGMSMDVTGMVMNANSSALPEDCSKISEDYKFTVSAGTEYAEGFAGTVFGFSEHEWRVKPCSRITITFENKDEVRHQWMLHGLPKYLYGRGMFHMEAAGGSTQVGSFIVPSDDKTYLVHCDIAQHMEKGMKAQLVVGSGNGSLWSIPGVSANFQSLDDSFNKSPWLLLCLSVFLGVAITLFFVKKPRV